MFSVQTWTSRLMVEERVQAPADSIVRTICDWPVPLESSTISTALDRDQNDPGIRLPAGARSTFRFSQRRWLLI
jgi:hypothetical protein